MSLVLALLVAAGAAPEKDAKAWYEEGQLHYRLGEFDDAIAAYKEAYRLKHLPALLYNIGLAYRQAKDSDKARFYFNQFLGDETDPKKRAAAQKQVKELDELAAKPAAPAATAASPEAAGAAPPSAPPSVERLIAEPPPIEDEVVVTRAAPPAPGVPPPVPPGPPPSERSRPSPEPAPELPAMAPRSKPPPAVAEASRSKAFPWPGVATVAGGIVLGGAGLYLWQHANGALGAFSAAPHPRSEVDAQLAKTDGQLTLAAALGGTSVAALAVGAGLLSLSSEAK